MTLSLKEAQGVREKFQPKSQCILRPHAIPTFAPYSPHTRSTLSPHSPHTLPTLAPRYPNTGNGGQWTVVDNGHWWTMDNDRRWTIVDNGVKQKV